MVFCLQIFVGLLAMCLVCTMGCGIVETLYMYEFQIYLPWETFAPGTSLGTKTGNKEQGATLISFLVFFSYLIVLNTVVPISLYVRCVNLNSYY